MRKTKTANKKETTSEKAPVVSLSRLKCPAGSHKKRKIVGRGSGSGHGKTSTRGSKGQTSRSGRDFYLGFEGGQSPLIRRMPKRGFSSQFRKEYQIVNLSKLSGLKATTINPELMEKEGLIANKRKPVKILGDGELKNSLTVQAHAFSRKAMDKIKGAGGAFEVI